MATIELDLRGLNCPIPVLRTNKKMKELIAGDELVVLVTDPAAPKDFATYSENTGHEILSSDSNEGVFTITLRKAG
jgi:tRNA 2-thiouridine synthesizing protein A